MAVADRGALTRHGAGAAWTPLISVVVPVLNERDHIEAALRSALDQDYPADRIEVIVADGGSDDGTREIVNSMASSDARVRLVDNPARRQGPGLNRAIEAARGELVARLDGHSAWGPSHLRRCTEVMERTGADVVGGTMASQGETVVARATACATRSPWAVGQARYRYATREMETETVFLGCFRRSALDRVGPFNEAAVTHEDYEMNHRIRASGGRIVFSPDLPTTYWPRTTWVGLGRQFFRYGRGKATVARSHPKVVRAYHLIPPMAVISVPILGLACASSRGRRFSAAAVAAYSAACAAASIRVTGEEPVAVKLVTMLIFPTIQLSWGLGFLVGAAAPMREVPHP